MVYFFTIFFLALAGVFNALMDASSEGLFKKDRLNKKTGGKYKYKNQDPSAGPAFLLSTTVLVGFTDGWHLFQLLFHSSWQLIIAINQEFIHPFFAFVAIKIIFGIIFELTYRRLKK